MQILYRIVIDQVIQFKPFIQVVSEIILYLRTVDCCDLAIRHLNEHAVFVHIIKRMIEVHIHSPFVLRIGFCSFRPESVGDIHHSEAKTLHPCQCHQGRVTLANP